MVRHIHSRRTCVGTIATRGADTLGLVKDPTRIPAVLAELQETWEAQPDLELTTLLDTLAQHGAGWGASDDDFVAATKALRRDRPLRLTEPPQVPHRVDTAESRITLAGRLVIVRSQTRPTVWELGDIGAVQVARPLVLLDVHGNRHRLGVVESITRLARAQRSVADISGTQRSRISDRVYILDLEDGRRVELGRRLIVWEQQRRTTSSEELVWDRLLRCAEGEPLRVRLRRGTDAEYAAVERILVADWPAP